MYLKRKIDTFLTAWKNNPTKNPLVVRGPRQVGKTESIRRFGQANYDSVIEINFVENGKYKHIVEDGYSAEAIVRNISLLDPSQKFIKGKTLLFFDELQEFPEIATALKFLKQDNRFDVICSGSMLGLNYKRIESNSVGYKTDYEMRSLDFEEFLWAKGYDEGFIDGLLANLLEAKPLSNIQHSTLMKAFLDYCTLGGMPAVLRRYFSESTFEGSLDTQRQLVSDYREDIHKYAEGVDKARILKVFKHIPAQLAKENKKFQVSKIEKGARFKDYNGCIEWLEMAGIINVCHCLSFPELPLRGNYEENKYKVYFGDSGLFVAMLDEEANEDLRANRNLGVYKGALYESIVSEALAKSGYDLFYYKRENSTLEEDFFIRTQSSLIPIEVKSKNGTSKSLRTLITSNSYPDIKFGIKLTAGNIGFENKTLTSPYFLAFLLKRLLKACDKGESSWFSQAIS